METRRWPTDTRICARTIYHYIEKDVFLEVTKTDLPRRERQAKRRNRRVEKRLCPPEKKRIHERSEACQERQEAKHWEMDCIESVKRDRTCLLTLVDRYSWEYMIFKLARQSQDAVLRRLNGLERRMGSKAFKARRLVK